MSLNSIVSLAVLKVVVLLLDKIRKEKLLGVSSLCLDGLFLHQVHLRLADAETERIEGTRR
jgi:hypothetical protein